MTQSDATSAGEASFSAPGEGGRITRDDIEAKLRDLQGGVDETADQAVSYVLVAGVAVVVGVVAIAYLLGRRKGKRRSTVVEVRRL